MRMPILLLIFGGIAASGQSSSSLSSFQAFQKAAVVLRHPRCLNCHVPGDTPLTGSNAEPHAMRVKRGADGLGSPLMRCGTCHQQTNGDLPHSPPGSEEWQLPPAKTKMAWVGLKDAQLCRLLLDPKENDGIGKEELIHHMEADPRMQWAWSPGRGREIPPLSHQEFVQLVSVWIEKGASCVP